jgi:hypothetical protein
VSVAAVGLGGAAIWWSLFEGLTDEDWALACERVEAMSVGVFEEWARLSERIGKTCPELSRDEAALVALRTFPDGPDFGALLMLDEMVRDTEKLEAWWAAERTDESAMTGA